MIRTHNLLIVRHALYTTLLVTTDVLYWEINGSILASHPAAPSLILGAPNFFQIEKFDVA